jgi:hypothetical protein
MSSPQSSLPRLILLRLTGAGTLSRRLYSSSNPRSTSLRYQHITMHFSALIALLPVLATVSVSAAPHLQHAPRSTSTSNNLAEVRVKPVQTPLAQQKRHSDEGAWYSDGADGSWQQQGSPTEFQEAGVDVPSPTPSAVSEVASTSSETYMSTVGPTPTPEPSSEDFEADTSSSALSTVSVTSTASTASKTLSEPVPSSTSDGSLDAAANDEVTTSTNVAPEPKETEKGKKIRYKQCPSTGTVSQIKVTPCEGGKGTILDPCHFHAGS